MADEGVGVRVVERLAADYHLPDDVQVLDGGTLGMDLLYYLEGIENLLLIDAVQAGKEPGALLKLEDNDVPSFLSMKISPHQIGIPDMLFAARLKNMYPSHVVLWGVQPALIEVSLELSDVVAPKVDTLVDKVVEQLEQWGHTIEAKSNHSSAN
ncbi:MAG: hydrogenase maturation protease [Chloroflexi bacterium]|nr:hydrogenase maturation protease [Chloroflexota bacterium]